jgi:hypothetical protein
MFGIFGVIFHPESEDDKSYWKGRILLQATLGHIYRRQ